MNYTHNEVEFLIQELKIELNGHLDGAEKNLIAEYCPYCHNQPQRKHCSPLIAFLAENPTGN